MLSIQIKDTVYQLPNSWKEITVAKYNAINNIIDVDDPTMYNLQLLAVLMDCEYKIIEDNLNDTQNIIKLLDTLNWLREEMPVTNKKLSTFGYSFVDNFQTITFGDWISIETLLKKDPKKSINAVLTILMKDVKGEHSQDILKSYEDIDKLNIIDVIYNYKAFIEHREFVYKMYSGFFKMKKDKPGLEEEIDRRAGLQKSTDMSKWIWLGLVEQLCGGLNQKPEEVYEMNLFAALDWLSYFKEKNDYQIEQQNKR